MVAIKVDYLGVKGFLIMYLLVRTDQSIQILTEGLIILITDGSRISITTSYVFIPILDKPLSSSKDLYNSVLIGILE